jgi:hypothetical protein
LLISIRRDPTPGFRCCSWVKHPAQSRSRPLSISPATVRWNGLTFRVAKLALVLLHEDSGAEQPCLAWRHASSHMLNDGHFHSEFEMVRCYVLNPRKCDEMVRFYVLRASCPNPRLVGTHLLSSSYERSYNHRHFVYSQPCFITFTVGSLRISSWCSSLPPYSSGCVPGLSWSPIGQRTL